MATEKIVMTFDGGTVKVETSGFSGSSCLKATKDLESALGKVTKDRKTAEYYDKGLDARQAQGR